MHDILEKVVILQLIANISDKHCIILPIKLFYQYLIMMKQFINKLAC